MSYGQEVMLPGSQGCQLQGYVLSKAVIPGMLYGTCLEPKLPCKIHCHDIQAFCRQAARCQDVQTVVRYNQQGVGSSSGSKSLWGAQDMADATALCQHILTMHNGPTHLHLVGYSWGACVAAHAAQLQHVTAFVGISPVTGIQSPQAPKTCDINSAKHMAAVMSAGGLASFFLRTKRHLSQLPPILPKMLILGDRDQFSSVASLQKVFGSEQSGRKQQDLAVPQTEHIPACFVLMTDCDHFYINQRKEMAEKVLHFCSKQFANQTKL